MHRLELQSYAEERKLKLASISKWYFSGRKNSACGWCKWYDIVD